MAANFFILWAILTNPHSVLTFSKPLRWNLRKPMFCFTIPNTVSTSVERAARKRRPVSLVRLALACRRYSSKRKLMRILRFPLALVHCGLRGHWLHWSHS